MASSRSASTTVTSLMKTSSYASGPSGINKECSRDGVLVELISIQAQVRADALALASASESLTYGKLEAESNKLAHYLRLAGVGPEVIVGLCMEPSPSMVVAALGILKAGGAYLPLDPRTPPERLSFMLNDSCAAVLIAGANDSRSLPTGRWQIVSLDNPALLEAPSDAAPHLLTRNDHLAYVIYTSGSTGVPKGVQITHGALLNLVNWHNRSFAVTSADRASQMANVSFDAAVWELWPYLTVGASVHFADAAARLAPLSLRDWLVKEKITVSFVPTMLAEQLISLKWPSDVALRTILTGADTLQHFPPPDLPFALINNYGPTECTVVTTSGAVLHEKRSERKPTIGRHIDNVQVHILNDKLEHVPAGMVGEMYVGGAGLARGYINRPQLSAESFIPNPFSDIPGERLYRTGDLGRYLENGDIAFVGRLDDQVKIRGYRVEPNEVATVLNRCPGVQNSTVVAVKDSFGEKNLVAYVVPAPNSQLRRSVLCEFLGKYLLNHMVPTVFVRMDSLPITQNGKIDRASLPVASPNNIIEDDPNVAPRTDGERRLAEILSKLLRLKEIGVTDNFFLLGGHSLLGAQLIAHIRDTFGIELPLRHIFEFPTVAELAERVQQLTAANSNSEATGEKMEPQQTCRNNEEGITQ